MLARLQQTSHLHCNCRPPGDYVAAAGKLTRGTAQGKRIDTKMSAKPLVLISEEQLHETRINISFARRQPPAPVACGVGTQQSALAVEHHMRIVESLAE